MNELSQLPRAKARYVLLRMLSERYGSHMPWGPEERHAAGTNSARTKLAHECVEAMDEWYDNPSTVESMKVTFHQLRNRGWIREAGDAVVLTDEGHAELAKLDTVDLREDYPLPEAAEFDGLSRDGDGQRVSGVARHLWADEPDEVDLPDEEVVQMWGQTQQGAPVEVRTSYDDRTSAATPERTKEVVDQPTTQAQVVEWLEFILAAVRAANQSEQVDELVARLQAAHKDQAALREEMQVRQRTESTLRVQLREREREISELQARLDAETQRADAAVAAHVQANRQLVDRGGNGRRDHVYSLVDTLDEENLRVLESLMQELPRGG